MSSAAYRIETHATDNVQQASSLWELLICTPRPVVAASGVTGDDPEC
jgi:hypothetical protein